MAIKLQKGQRINLKKETGAELKQFCINIIIIIFFLNN